MNRILWNEDLLQKPNRFVSSFKLEQKGLDNNNFGSICS